LHYTLFEQVLASYVGMGYRLWTSEVGGCLVRYQCQKKGSRSGSIYWMTGKEHRMTGGLVVKHVGLRVELTYAETCVDVQWGEQKNSTCEFCFRSEQVRHTGYRPSRSSVIPHGSFCGCSNSGPYTQISSSYNYSFILFLSFNRSPFRLKKHTVIRCPPTQILISNRTTSS
jgi:hypothetical protein